MIFQIIQLLTILRSYYWTQQYLTLLLNYLNNLLSPFQPMNNKYRIKLINNLKDYQNCEPQGESLSRIKTNRFIPLKELTPKRSKSELVVSQQQEISYSKQRIKNQPLIPSRQLFSKLRPIQFSLQHKKQNRRRNKTVPQQSLSKLGQSLSPTSLYGRQYNQQTQIQKFPHYVSKSNQMVETKQKLLELKHRIKFQHKSPVLESIQNSVNQDRIGFTRKMKVELCKKGNTSLMEHFEKDVSHFQEHHSPSKQKNIVKPYRPIDLPYLIALRHNDQNMFENHQRMQKMQDIKKKLKAVRVNNLKHLK